SSRPPRPACPPYPTLFRSPGKEGLVHISKLSHERVSRVEDVVNIGDELTVMVTDIDAFGRINLTRKDLLPPPEPSEKRAGERNRSEEHTSELQSRENLVCR